MTEKKMLETLLDALKDVERLDVYEEVNLYAGKQTAPLACIWGPVLHEYTCNSYDQFSRCSQTSYNWRFSVMPLATISKRFVEKKFKSRRHPPPPPNVPSLAGDYPMMHWDGGRGSFLGPVLPRCSEKSAPTNLWWIEWQTNWRHYLPASFRCGWYKLMIFQRMSSVFEIRR